MNENTVTGDALAIDATTTKPETTFEIESQLANEIEDDVRKRQKELGRETKKIVYRGGCVIVSLLLYYYVGRPV